MYGCGEQEAGVASGNGWNLWVCAIRRPCIMNTTIYFWCYTEALLNEYYYLLLVL